MIHVKQCSKDELQIIESGYGNWSCIFVKCRNHKAMKALVKMLKGTVKNVKIDYKLNN